MFILARFITGLRLVLFYLVSEANSLPSSLESTSSCLPTSEEESTSASTARGTLEAPWPLSSLFSFTSRIGGLCSFWAGSASLLLLSCAEMFPRVRGGCFSKVAKSRVVQLSKQLLRQSQKIRSSSKTLLQWKKKELKIKVADRFAPTPWKL